MSQGQKNDLSNTENELKKPSGLTKGKNWLRHTGQARRIDEMLLVGATKQEIAQDLIESGLFKKDLKTAIARVQNHISHIVKDEHMIPLNIDANGVLRFSAIVLDGKNLPDLSTNRKNEKIQTNFPNARSSEVLVHLHERIDSEDIKI